jgi:energy-coupling factor transport system substrate-specific component
MGFLDSPLGRRAELVIVAAALCTFAAAAWAALDPARSGLSLLLAAVALLVGGAAWLETGPGSAKELAVVATLGAVAAAGRVLFQAVPGVQPVTVIAVAAGAALGMRAGIGVGAIAAFVSNFFLGQGIWTPWQMLAWGACGAIGAALAPILRGRLSFAVVCFVLGFAFSGLMDLWMWFSFFPHTWDALAVQIVRGFPFQATHAVANFAIAFVIGPDLRRLLERYGRRLHVEVSWA